MSAEEYLAWISDVDRFFDYYSIPDDGSRVVRVVFRLRGKASTWWEKLENNRLQDGRNLVCTWRRMKQLLKVRFFPLGYKERLYESKDGCMKSTYPLKHGKTNVFPTTIVDVEEKVQLEEASMKGDKFKEEEVESKNEAAQEELGVCTDTEYTRNQSEPTPPLRRSPLVFDRPLRRSPLVSDRPQTIRHMIEDDCADNGIPLPNVTSKILAKVVEYCKKHVEAAAESKSEDRPSPATAAEDELKAWDADFVKVDQATLFDLILVPTGYPEPVLYHRFRVGSGSRIQLGRVRFQNLGTGPL
ncbi:hypothetical protein CRG98_028477 [Punica granatum]|uniref:SKP1 component POZ domain-containing protein n=2 Tax=rosids TaxID=71275 RepID=A0A2I0J4H3_PUNGR|nr:hypothetical protein CRG98_028477 [Punica granatum]